MNNQLPSLPVKSKQSARRLADRLLFLCLAGLVNSAAFGQPARVDEVHGDVQIRAVGALRWDSVVPGQKVEEGVAIKTGPDAQVEILTEQGHRFIVHAESTIEFTSLQADETKVRLESGRVLSKVVKLKDKQRFSVQTPTAVCAVRGTEFDTVSGQRGTLVSVYHGVVGVAVPGSNDEIRVPAGQMTSVHNGKIEVPHTLPRESRTTADAGLGSEARHEVGLDMSRNEVIASAAMEARMADYREGKSLIDVNGNRVRLEEYVVRPQPDQFKLVVLDERDSRLDYFFYKGTFNQTLPADLSIALKDLSGKVGATAPAYYLKAYEMGQSNTQDSVHDTAVGGHLVQVKVDGNGNYLLTDPANPANTRIVQAAQQQIDPQGNITYKVYNPLSDTFSVVTPAQLSGAERFAVYLPENDSFKDLAPGDTLWKTRFNGYTHAVNEAPKITYAASGPANTLVTALDATWSYAGGTVLQVVETDAANLDSTVTNWYGDGTWEKYRTVLIDDHGAIAPQSAFTGVATGAAYKTELLKWNYEQQVTASDFQGRKIDLVVEPKIFIKSGLIQ